MLRIDGIPAHELLTRLWRRVVWVAQWRHVAPRRLALRTRIFTRLGQLCERTMDKWEKYRAYAAKCEHQATICATEAERGDWIRIAKAWLALIPSYARTAEEDASLLR
jgi:hypothetical protein